MPVPASTTQESRIVKNFRVGLIEALIGPYRYQVKAEQGNLNVAIPGPSIAVYLDRGQFVDPDDPDDEPNVQYDQDQAMTGSFTAHMREPYGDENFVALTDFITKIGQLLARWGTELRRSGPASPKLCTLQFWLKGSKVGDPRNKGYRFKFCNVSGNIGEGSPTTVSCNFTSYSLYPEPARWEA